MHRIDIGGREYCVGLWWQDLDHGERVKNKIKNILSDFPEFNVYALRKTQPRQIGFGKTEDVKAQRLPCLAPCLAGYVNAESFVGWFRISPEKIWIFALVDNVILADVGDFYGTEDEAEEVFNELQQMGEAPWGDEIYIYNNIDEALEFLQQCVSQSKKVPKLYSTKVNIDKSHVIAIIIAVVLMFASFYGINKYKAHKKKQSQIAKQEAYQDKIDNEKKDIDMDKHRTEHFPKKWEEYPENQHMITRCIKVKDEIELYRKGWQFHKYSCNLKSFSVVRERSKDGSFVNLPSRYKFNPKTPNKIINKKNFNSNDIQKRDEKQLYSASDIAAYLYEIARLLKSPISVEISSLEPVKIKEGEQTKTIKPPYKKGTFETEVSGGMLKGAEDIFDSPGLIVRSLVYKDNQWKIKGDIYAEN